ncbi:MAG: PspC domain-containing protein [Patescibacteria group bacterium]
MNEIKKIHLGRQPFTISVEAHKALRAYLDAIEEAVGAKTEVLKEVELRMAELLIERGITDEKVVLAEDVAFLKEQLGKPGDFKDEEDHASSGAGDVSGTVPKRLYRDPKNGMIAGVCSGLGAYFGIDATVVRLIFVVVTLLGGWGILVYIILWLVTPEANTSSERLHMQGKAVTVDSLKQLVDRADLPGAAERANKAAGPFLESVAKVILAVVGIICMTIATCGLFALAITGVYTALNRGDVVSPAYPVGSTDVVFAVCLAIAAAMVFIFMALTGVAMTRRKWPIAGWITAALIGIFFMASTVGAALAPTVINKIQDHCQDNGCSFSEETIIESRN